MIPLEIVQVIIILGLAVLWLSEKGRRLIAEREKAKAQERVTALELENASLSGALADRSPLDAQGKGWTRPRGAPQ